MFFNSQHLLRRLREKGRPATAEVIWIKTIREGKSMRALWAPDEDLNLNWVDCLLRLRVVPSGGGDPPFEATVTTRISPLRQLGVTVPVWYDPRDTRKVAVDHFSTPRPPRDPDPAGRPAESRAGSGPGCPGPG